MFQCGHLPLTARPGHKGEEGPHQACAPQPRDKVFAALAPAGDARVHSGLMGHGHCTHSGSRSQYALEWGLKHLGDPLVMGGGYRLVGTGY